VAITIEKFRVQLGGAFGSMAVGSLDKAMVLKKAVASHAHSIRFASAGVGVLTDFRFE
jgi:hypothetical protein